VASAERQRGRCLCYKNQSWQEVVKRSTFSFEDFFLIFARYSTKLEGVKKLKRKFHKNPSRGESACCMRKDRKKKGYGEGGIRVLLVKLRMKLALEATIPPACVCVCVCV
jgi:hypothetical protein